MRTISTLLTVLFIGVCLLFILPILNKKLEIATHVKSMTEKINDPEYIQSEIDKDLEKLEDKFQGLGKK